MKNTGIRTFVKTDSEKSQDVSLIQGMNNSSRSENNISCYNTKDEFI